MKEIKSLRGASVIVGVSVIGCLFLNPFHDITSSIHTIRNFLADRFASVTQSFRSAGRQKTNFGPHPDESLISSYSLSGKEFKNNPFCNDIENLVDKYACWVEQAAEGINLAQDKQLSVAEVSAFKTIDALNLVSVIASSGRYAYLMRQPGFRPPDMMSQQSLLSRGYGICGNHQQLFIEILRKAGVEARPVDFYFKDSLGRRQNHAAAEAEIGGKWVYIDVTWGAFWVERTDAPATMLTLQEILRGEGTRVSGNGSWYFNNIHRNLPIELRDPFGYLKSPDLQILRNKGGLLEIELKDGLVDFSDIPNYIGKNKGNTPLEMIIRGTFRTTEATLEIAAFEGCDNSELKVGNRTYTIAKGKIEIQLEPNTVVRIDGTDPKCYAVISSLAASATPTIEGDKAK